MKRLVLVFMVLWGLLVEPASAAEIGGSKFLSGEVLGPVLDSLVFAGIAFGVVLLILYVLCKTPVHHVVIPQFHELELIAAKYRDGKPIDQAEATLALACAVNGGLRIVGVLFVVGLLAAFL